MTDAIQVEGLARANRALKKLGDDLAPKLKEAARRAAEEVATTARTMVPRGRARDRRPGHPGLLEASIRTGATNKSATIKAGSRRVPYAPAIHFGWSTRGSSRYPHAKGGPIRPQPFIYEALDRRRDDVVERFTAQVAALCDELDEGGA